MKKCHRMSLLIYFCTDKQMRRVIRVREVKLLAADLQMMSHFKMPRVFIDYLHTTISFLSFYVGLTQRFAR